jgi:hypothetical protein
MGIGLGWGLGWGEGWGEGAERVAPEVELGEVREGAGGGGIAESGKWLRTEEMLAREVERLHGMRDQVTWCEGVRTSGCIWQGGAAP